MSNAFAFEEVARLPAPGDNAAIALRQLEPGYLIHQESREYTIGNTILEGHRFAVKTILEGELLLSWGAAFGRARKRIVAGEYLSNARMLGALRERHVPFGLPAEANFENYRTPFTLEESSFRSSEQILLSAQKRTFQGFLRERNRGVGTRNYIVILGVTSRTGSFARLLAERFQDVPGAFRNIDGVVPIAHTEGGGTQQPNNFELLLRTLAGFVTHPNVGGFISIDFGNEVLTNAMLGNYLKANDNPFGEMPHAFVTLENGFADELQKQETIIRGWLPTVNGCRRSVQPLGGLKIGLQCGGSDAFSAVSANPLLGIMSRELVRHGGSANLAETDELMGAESYVLGKVRDYETAASFLKKLAAFQTRASWHGHTAEGNPSGGNLFRGLYNISIKSIGAARKKDPQVRLDEVIEYSERMERPGFYFMDSPGNDLESIAGQVAAGCNLILFATGNGSITNFPFVPTIKVMTTTARFNLLSREMDFNAGRYLDGESLEGLGSEAFEQMIAVASGTPSAGERAGHSQVQIWREWRQAGPAANADTTPMFAGAPLLTEISGKAFGASERLSIFRSGNGFARDQIGLIMPTSLCAGEIAKMIARKLNQDAEMLERTGVSRFVALAHTEGCGNSAGVGEEILLRTMSSHLRHPSVRRALLLEHGCEKTHNDAMRNYIEATGASFSDFGWASVQSDGGINRVIEKAIHFFQARGLESPRREETGIDQLKVGFIAQGSLSAHVSEAFSRLAERIVRAGGAAVLPANLMEVAVKLKLEKTAEVTLDYAEPWREAGLHVMHLPTDHTGEIVTGLAGTGVEIILAFTSNAPLQSHPIVPVIQMTDSKGRIWENDIDFTFSVEATSEEIVQAVWPLLLRVYSGEANPKLFASGNTDFQVTRGLWGVSL